MSSTKITNYTNDYPYLMTCYGAYSNFNAATGFTTGNVYFTYMGTSPKKCNSVALYYQLRTALVTPTWAEVGIFVGRLNFCGNASLKCVGWKNVISINILPLRQVKLELILNRPILQGEGIWVGMGSSSSTTFQVDGTLSDDIQTGIFQTSTTRPSQWPNDYTATTKGANNLTSGKSTLLLH